MAWQLSKIMDVGTGNPIVARLGMGLSDVIRMAQFPKEKQDAITGQCFKIMTALIQAEKSALPLIEELKSINLRIASEGIKTQSEGRVIETPGVLKIEDVRVFLKYGKQALQSLGKAMGIIFDRSFEGPYFHKIRELAQEQFGVGNPVANLIASDEIWIKELLDLRNEDEHPKSRKQFVRGYFVSAENGRFVVNVPRFYNEAPVLNRLEMYSNNLLTFSEELLALTLAQFFPPIVRLCEIPEDQRDPQAPVRFTLGLKEGFDIPRPEA